MKKSLIILAILLLPFLIIPTTSSQAPSSETFVFSNFNTTYVGLYLNMTHHGFLTSQSQSFILGILNVSNYTVEYSNYLPTTITYSEGINTWLITFSSLNTFSGNIEVDVTNGVEIQVTSQIPNLVRVISVSGKFATVIWAGIYTPGETIKGYGFINGTGDLILQFANGSALYNLTIPVEENYSNVIYESINLYEIENVINIYSSSSSSLSYSLALPHRYMGFKTSLHVSNETAKMIEKYNNTVLDIYSTQTPAIMWGGSVESLFFTSVLVNLTFLNEMYQFYHMFKANVNVSGYIAVGYGINGSKVGGIIDLYANGYANVTVRNSFMTSEMSGYATISPFYSLFALEIYTKPSQLVTVKQVFIHGLEVFVGVTQNGSIVSTEHIMFTHEVYQGKLMLIGNSTLNSYLVLFNNNSIYNVSVGQVVEENNVTVNYNSTLHYAEVIYVLYVGNYTVFNVSVHGVVIAVLNANMQPINSEDYFMVGSNLTIFADPTSTYYVVYQQTVPTTTTSTTTISSTTTTSSTTSSTTTTSTTTSTTTTSSTSSVIPSTSSTIPTSPPTSSTPPSSTSTSTSYLTPIIAIVIVVVIIIAAVVILKR
ncbi:hypothetical protein SJAV_01230 [Sulfurisphaera javensis]|uniref:Thermopsin n=1 Tax=Sulfurisphaera javensis TaxID=2049879 RepID=A0AAT9GN28_9CREN